MDEVLKGISECMWALAWADAMEEAGQGRRLSGTDITEVMPELPQCVVIAAAKVYGAFEALCGCSMPVMCAQAARADWEPTSDDENDRDAQEALRLDARLASEDEVRFGYCLAYKWLGHGVSWLDDHNDFKVGCGRQEKLFSEVRAHGETPYEVMDAAAQAVRDEYGDTHWVYGSGSPGCLYDNGPHCVETAQDAIEALCDTFNDLPQHALDLMRADLEAHGLHYFSHSYIYDEDGEVYDEGAPEATMSAASFAGAGMCEISRQDGPCPAED